MINLIPKLSGVFVYIRAHLIFPPITLGFNLLLQISLRLHTSKCLFNRHSAPRTASEDAIVRVALNPKLRAVAAFPWGKGLLSSCFLKMEFLLSSVVMQMSFLKREKILNMFLKSRACASCQLAMNKSNPSQCNSGQIKKKN